MAARRNLPLRPAGLGARSVTASSNWKSLSATGLDPDRRLARQVGADALEHHHQLLAIALDDAVERDLEGLERERPQLVEQLLAARGQIEPPDAAIVGI